MKNTLIKLNHVSKRYEEGSDSREILTDINAEIQATEVVSFIGKSGIGKSTLLNLISGIDVCDSGDILIDEIFPELQLAVRINHITEIELSAASEIFICNSVKGIVPVTGILNQDQSKIKPIGIGSNTRDLQLMLAQLYPSFK